MMLKSPQFSTAAIALLALFTVPTTLAQRPTNASVCDYYATTLYGTNTSDTQQQLVRSIVSLAFEGGSNLTNKSADITGILRPGKFGGVDVDLGPWFNGSKKSTNLNNEPIAINWLDEGGTAPLAAFLTGVTPTVALTNSTNQYHLFTNFFIAFSRAFGCTLPFPPLPSTSGPLSLAYVHKFMNLDYNQLGYFIFQLTKATEHYGFSTQDSATLSTRLNSLYNVRCAPAVTFSPAQGPQLLSLCQNPTCPLAAPVSDCAAYANLTANPVASVSPTTAATTVTNTATGSPTSSSTPAASSSSAPPPAAASKPLSTGAIAGVAIGGAAVLLFAVVALIWVLRRKRKPEPEAQPADYAQHQSQQFSTAPTMYSPTTPKEPHMSYYSTGQPVSEMDNSRYQSPGGLSPRIGSPDVPGQHQYQYSAPVEMGSAPVEMEGSEYGQQHQQRWQGGPPHHSPNM